MKRRTTQEAKNKPQNRTNLMAIRAALTEMPLHGDSFGAATHEFQLPDSSCIQHFDQESIKRINTGVTRTSTFERMTPRSPVMQTVSAEECPSFGAQSSSTPQARMTPVPQSAQESFYQKSLSLMATLEKAGNLETPPPPSRKNSEIPSPPRIQEDADPQTPTNLEQEQGRTSLNFTRLLIKKVDQKESSRSFKSDNNNIKMTDQEDHDKKSDTERIEHLGIKQHLLHSPRLSYSQNISDTNLLEYGHLVGNPQQTPVTQADNTLNNLVPGPELKDKEDSRLVTQESPQHLAESQRISLNTLLMRGFESHNAQERYTFEEMINAKRGGSTPPLDRQSIKIKHLPIELEEHKLFKHPSSSEPGSGKRVKRNQQQLGYVESAFPRLQSERKLSQSQLPIPGKLTNQGMGTASFNFNTEGAESPALPMHTLQDVTPPTSKNAGGFSQRNDQVVASTEKPSSPVQRNADASPESIVKSKKESFKAKMHAIIALSKKKKTPLEVRPQIRENKDSILRYGLMVELFAQHPFLSHRETPAVMYAQDLLDGTVSISNNSDVVTPASQKGDDRFVIMPLNTIKSRFKISRQIDLLHQFKDRKGKNITASDQINDGVYIRENVENLLSEVKENCETYFQMVGQPVHYGEKVHICHLKSKRFLSVKKRQKEILKHQGTVSSVGGGYMSPAKKKANAVKFMPFEIELTSELTQQSIFRFLPLFSYQELGSEIRQQTPFTLCYTPSGSVDVRQNKVKEFSAFYIDDLAFAGTRNRSLPASASPSVIGMHTPKSVRSGIYTKYEEQGIGSPLLLQENGRTQFKFRYALKQDTEENNKIQVSKELPLPENPLLLLHTKVLLIKNIDAESYFTVSITTRQKMILDKCRNIKRKITMLRPTFELFSSKRSGSLHSKRSDTGKEEEKAVHSSLVQSKFLPSQSSSNHLSLQEELDERLSLNLSHAKKIEGKSKSRALVSSKLKKLRSKREGSLEKQSSDKGNFKTELENINEEENKETMPRSPLAREALKKEKKREKMAQKIKNYESPSLQQLIYTYPKHFHKKSISLFFSKQSESSQASNLWEVMINPDDPSTLLFRHLLFDVTLRPLKPVFLDLFDKEPCEAEKKRQLIVKLHLQNQDKKFLHVLANKYNPIDHKFLYTKFGIIQKEDQSGLSDLFGLQPPLDPGTSLGVKFVQMCSNYLYRNKTFVPFTKQLDRLHDILQKIKLFTTNSLPEYFDDSFNYGAISQRHQTLIRESLIMQRLFEILTEIVEFDEDRIRYSEESDFDASSSWSGNAANQPSVPPDDIINLILDICILNISMHKENTKYVLIYLFPKHLLKEKVFVPFSNQIMSLAQQIAHNIKPIIGSVDGSLKIILKQLIFYMISDWKGKSSDKTEKKEIITTLRVFFKTLKEHGMKDLVRQVFSTLTITNTGDSFHGSDTKPMPGNASSRKHSTSEKVEDTKPPARKVIMFHKQPLQVDPDYVIPLLHSSLLQSEQQVTSLDDSLNLGMSSARFKPHQIIEAFNRLDRDLLKRQLYLYANICECMSANYSQVQTHRICLLIREWEYFVEYSDQKNTPHYEENHLVKAGLLRLLYTLLTVTDRSVVCNPKSVRFFADQEEEDISLRCEKTVLGTDFSNFNNEAIQESMTDFKVQLTEPEVTIPSGRATQDNNNSQTQRSLRPVKKRFLKTRRGQMARSRSIQQGRPILGSVLLSSEDIETLFEVESLDFEENLDPYTLRESHVEFMKIINYFVSAGILQYQDDFKIARRTLALIIQAFHKYISVCAESEKEFEEKYTKFEDLGTKQLKDVAALLQESEGFQITSNKGGVSERNPAKSFPKINSLDLHILELEVKMKKQEILEGAFGKVRLHNQHPTLFRNFEILHTYLGLVNSCLNTKLVSKSQIKRLETEKKRIERRKTKELEDEAKSPKNKSKDYLVTPRRTPFSHGKKLSAGRRTSITADLPRTGNEQADFRGGLSYDDTLQSKVMIEICCFFRNLLLVDYDRVLTEYTAILKTHFYSISANLSPRKLEPRPSDVKLIDSMKESRNMSLSKKPRQSMNQLDQESPQVLERELDKISLKEGTCPIRAEDRLSAAQNEKKELDKAVESVSEKLIHHLFHGEEFNQTEVIAKEPTFKREGTVEVEKLLVTHEMQQLDHQIQNDEFDLKKIPTFFLVGSDPGRRVVIIEALCEWFNTCKSQELRKEIALLVPRLIYHKRDVMRALVNYFSLFDNIISEEKYISVLTNLSFFKLKLNQLESWRSLLKDQNEIEDAQFDSMTTQQILQHSRAIDGPSQKEKDITRLIESLRVIRDFLAQSPIAGIHQLDQHQRDAQTTQEEFKQTDMTYSTPASTLPLSSSNYSHYLNLGQLWLRETGGYKIILELLIKATSIRTKALRMIYDVFKYDEQRRPPQISLKVIQLFTIAADIVTLFIRQNSKNKALITKHIFDLVPYFGEEFIVGQIYETSLPARQLNGATIRMLKEAVTDNSMLAGEERLVYSFIDALNTRLNKNKLINLLVLFTGIIGSTHDPTIAEYSISYLLEKRSLKDLGADQGLLYNQVNPYLQRLRNIISGNQFKYAIEKYTALAAQLQKTLAMNNRYFQPSSSFQDFHQDDHGYLSLRNIPGVKLEETTEPEPELTKSNRQYLEGSSLYFQTTDPVGPTPPLLQLLPVEDSPARQELPPSQQILVVNESRYNILQRIRSYILISSEVKNKIEEEEKEIFSRLFGNPCDAKNEMNVKERRKILQTKKRRQHIVADFISYIKKEIEVMEDENDPESLMIPQDHSGVKLGLSLLSTIFDNFTSKKMGMLNLLLIELLVKMLNASSIPSVNPLMPQVLHFANILVGDGDQEIQSKFYECFKKTEGNQHFGYINSLIERAIHSLNSGSSKAILAKRQTPFEFVIDQNYQACFFLKSLCEGHHQEFQAFLTDQQTSSNNFDMISLIVKYLNSLITRVKGKIQEKMRTLKAIVDLSKLPIRGRQSNRRHGVNMIPRKIAKVDELSEDEKAYIFKNAKMCLVALTEFVQGPCFPNQLRVVEADYLRCARIILRDLHFTFDNHPTSHGLSNLQVLLLKSDCVLCLLSLIEQRGPNDVLLKAIRSEIKLSNIEHHIVYCYFAFDQLMGGKFISNEQYFGSDDEDNQTYTLEPAFNFFVFALKMNEVQIKLDKKYKPKGLFEHTTFKKDVLRHSVIGSLINFIDDANDTRVDQSARPKTLDQLSEHTFKSNFYTYEKEAGVFFAKHTAKIQILNNGNLEEIYFPRAPSYKNLNAEQKQNFVYSLELEKDQVQMDSVIEQGDALIDRLRGEYKFKKFFQKYGLLGVVLFYSNLWKTLGYYLTLLINFFIFVSYTSELGSDRFAPRLFLTLSTFWTQIIFDVLGFMMLSLAVSGNFLLISNRLPQHFNNIFVGPLNPQKREEGSRKINHDIQLKNLSKRKLLLGFISLFWLIITDMQLLYDILYVVCAFLGLFVSHIFYSFHVLDIIVRSPLLVNILKSLWRPRRELLLTLVLFLVIEYLFTTFAYWYFGKDYPLNECISIVSCFMTNVDQTFKNDGGIGAYMEMKVQNQQEMYDSSYDIPFARILFDQLFNLMLVILIVQIIAAIMIDTFGALRDETSTIRELITTSCIVCGKTRDEIERDEDNFENHIHKEHNLFNYIMFLAYLKRKSKIDLTGSESYVWEMYQDQDPRWFPIYQRRAGAKKKDYDSDQEGEIHRFSSLEEKVDQNAEMLQKVLGKVKEK